MSRIGKKDIKIPSGVALQVNDTFIEVSGPKGSIKRDFFGRVSIKEEKGILYVLPVENIENQGAYWGLYRTLIANMIEGVSKGYQKLLEIQGTGYRATMSGKSLSLSLGYSHSVNIAPPAGISFDVDKTGKVSVMGADKEFVGQIAAKIRSSRPVEPYKGKGIRYFGEVVKTKVGKSTSKK